MTDVNVFFLSIKKKYADRILEGTKQWEFRANPGFGIFDNGLAMAAGDTVFIVSVPPDGPGVIEFAAEVLQVLSGDDFRKHFGAMPEEKWAEEAGYCPADYDSMDRFREHILEEYSAAMKVRPVKLETPVPVTQVARRFKPGTWKGIGCGPVSQLKRFAVGGVRADEFFEALADSLLSDS